MFILENNKIFSTDLNPPYLVADLKDSDLDDHAKIKIVNLLNFANKVDSVMGTNDSSNQSIDDMIKIDKLKTICNALHIANRRESNFGDIFK